MEKTLETQIQEAKERLVKLEELADLRRRGRQLEDELDRLDGRIRPQDFNPFPQFPPQPVFPGPQPYRPQWPFIPYQQVPKPPLDVCQDGFSHDFPDGWLGVIPPSCRKCGKQAVPFSTVTVSNSDGSVYEGQVTCSSAVRAQPLELVRVK